MIDYHKVGIGSIEDIVVSHSSLNALDPDIGGHPTKFLAFFGEEERITTPSMERGDLLHLWMEHEDKFAIAELDAPTEQMLNFSDAFFNLYFKEQYKTREGIAESIALTIDELFQIGHIYEGFYGKKPFEGDVDLLGACIFLARKDAQVSKTWKNNTILEKFETLCVPYIRFLQKADGRIVLSKQNKEILTGCHNSIKNHPQVKILLDYLKPGDGKFVGKEVAFFWESGISNIQVKRKAKLDNIFADFDKKILVINDYKTTSYPVSQFNSPTGAFYKWKLGRQLVNYVDGFTKAYPDINIDTWKVYLNNIVVQTTDAYPCIVYSVGFSTRHECKQDLNKILHRVAFHIKENKFDLTMEEYLNGSIEI
jgi:hypothetical protein